TTLRTGPACPARVLSCCPRVVSHNSTFPFSQPAAIVCSCGANDKERISLHALSTTDGSRVCMSQSFIVPSLWPVAKRPVPETAITLVVNQFVSLGRGNCFNVCVSQRFTPLSPRVASILPELVKAI